MKRKNFDKSKKMTEVELPSMPERPKNVQPKISSTVMEKVSEAAALCVADPKVLKAFFEELREQYPEGGQPISLISIMPSGEKGIDATLTLFPTISSGDNRALIHTLGLRCMEGLTIKDRGAKK